MKNNLALIGVSSIKIIGWTDWDNPEYKEMFPIGEPADWNAIEEVQQTIADELRANQYKFTGEYHQNGDYGVPIFEDGTVYQCSQRTWGAIMAMAYPEEVGDDNCNYCVWAWRAPIEMSVPNPKNKL